MFPIKKQLTLKEPLEANKEELLPFLKVAVHLLKVEMSQTVSHSDSDKNANRNNSNTSPNLLSQSEALINAVNRVSNAGASLQADTSESSSASDSSSGLQTILKQKIKLLSSHDN